MKSAIIAVLTGAAMAQNLGGLGDAVSGLTGDNAAQDAAPGGNSPVSGLGLDRLLAGVDIKLPAGIEITANLGPKYPPPAGCTDVWHPPHHVPMDGCDNNGDDHWHWVHPCERCEDSHHTWTTSTITETCLTTVISCAPTVTNCPANGAHTTTITIAATTTICPVAVTSTAAPITSTWTAPAAQTTWSTEVIPPCPTTETPWATTTPPPVVIATTPANQTWTPVVVGAANKAQGMGIAAIAGAIAAMFL